MGNVNIPCPQTVSNVLKGPALFPPPREYPLLNGTQPAFLARQFGDMVGSGQMIELIRRYRRLAEVGIKATHSGDSRSRAPALHLGLWRRSCETAFLTSDTKRWTSREQVEAMNGFLHAVQTYIAPKVARLTKLYDPEQWALQERYLIGFFLISKSLIGSKRLQQYLLKETTLLTQNPNANFYGAFTTVAVKEGVSENLHVDYNDGGITWVIPLGDWEGAQLQLPQLKISIGLVPGDILGFQGRLLAHYNTPISSGTRVVLTCFTCRNVLSTAQEHVET
jgi:hypothetical protein